MFAHKNNSVRMIVLFILFYNKHSLPSQWWVLTQLVAYKQQAARGCDKGVLILNSGHLGCIQVEAKHKKTIHVLRDVHVVEIKKPMWSKLIWSPLL